jgi:hypothetical protein
MRIASLPTRYVVERAFSWLGHNRRRITTLAGR